MVFPIRKALGQTAMISFMLVGGVALGGIPVEAQDQPAGGTEVVHNAPVPNGQQGDQQGTVTASPGVPGGVGTAPAQDQAASGVMAAPSSTPPSPPIQGPINAPNGEPASGVVTVQNAPKPYGPAGPPVSTPGSVAANAPAPGQPAGLTPADPVTQAALLAGDGTNLGAATIRPAGKGVLLTINLTKAPPGTYTASIHRGTCARPGPAYGRETLSLQPGVDGGAHGEGVASGVTANGSKGAIVVVTGSSGQAACGVLKALVG